MPKLGGKYSAVRSVCLDPFMRRTMSNPQDSDFVEHPGAVAFAATLERLDRAIEAAGMMIFSRIDHAAGAQAAGLDMPPTGAGLWQSQWRHSDHALNAPGGTRPAAACTCAQGEDGRTLVSFRLNLP